VTPTPVAELSFQIRPYGDEDEPEVLALLATALGEGPGGDRSAEFFRWKHLANPAGRSLMLVAETAGRIIGFRSLMRWRFRAGDRDVLAVRPVDTATHPDFQGHGVFSRLTRESLRQLEDGVDLVYNTPNEKSLPGYRKMGWRVAGSMPVSVRIRHPVRFGLRLRGGDAPSQAFAPRVRADTAKEALVGVAPLLEVGEGTEPRLHTPTDTDYLRWRYGAAPLLDYRVVRDEVGNGLRGIAIFRVRARGRLWESTVADVIVRAGDTATARRLLGRVARAADVDHLTCSFPVGSATRAAARGSAFIRAPRGITLAVNRLRRDLVPDPGDPRSWALCLGDLEVF